ncbi:hypothetical protein PQR46_35330 [Paraburkholderia sediminicola]|uniref:hypothetical protein n=1 Tax=Paraburkholderia sediminicola TaxID=458836 RepID=UPI0038BD4F01
MGHARQASIGVGDGVVSGNALPSDAKWISRRNGYVDKKYPTYCIRNLGGYDDVSVIRFLE